MAEPSGTSTKIRGQTPREQPSEEILKLRTANLIGSYGRQCGGNAMQSSLSDEERIRLFHFNMEEHCQRPHKRCERLPGSNPLTISDKAREYFQMADTSAIARNMDEQARSALTSAEADKGNGHAPKLAEGAIVRIGSTLLVAVATVGVAYFLYRWYRRPVVVL